MKLKLSALAIEELRTKLDILDDEPDLREDYRATDEAIDRLQKKLRGAKPGLFDFDSWEVTVINDELQNSADLASGNDARALKYVLSQINYGGIDMMRTKLDQKKAWNRFQTAKKAPKRSRSYPVRCVVEELNERVATEAKRLIALYEANTRSLGRIPVKINDRPLDFYAVDQNAGRAYYNRKGRRIVTIPVSVMKLNDSGAKPGYFTNYVAHELAHHYHHISGHHGSSHGLEFMHWMKQLCPKEYLHYELEYKPRFARAAGIRKPDEQLAA